MYSWLFRSFQNVMVNWITNQCQSEYAPRICVIRTAENRIVQTVPETSSWYEQKKNHSLRPRKTKPSTSWGKLIWLHAEFSKQWKKAKFEGIKRKVELLAYESSFLFTATIETQAEHLKINIIDLNN